MPKPGALLFILTACLGLALVSCGDSEPKAQPSGIISKRYDFAGTVVSVNREEKEATIDHEAIEGFMEPMRMGFTIPEAEDLAKLLPGAKIKAILVVENSMMWVEDVSVIGQSDVPPPPSEEPPKQNHP